MSVVSNMTPLHYLILVRCEHILPKLFGQILTPRAVIEEMSDPSTPEAVRRWAASPPEWVRVVQPDHIEDIPILGKGKRGAGEKAAIALAREVGADALLIDDNRAIREAKKRGVETVRMLTALETAAERGLIENLPEVLDSLETTTPFYIGRECRRVMAEMRRRDQERKLAQEHSRPEQKPSTGRTRRKKR
jgi:predicted nucleic acid-binding protein